MKRWLNVITESTQEPIAENNDWIANTVAKEMKKNGNKFTEDEILSAVEEFIGGCDSPHHIDQFEVADLVKQKLHTTDEGVGSAAIGAGIGAAIAGPVGAAAGAAIAGGVSDATNDAKTDIAKAALSKGGEDPAVLDEWNVLYDSTHARNVRARVRLPEGTDENGVKEWFNKTFKPLSVHEVRKGQTIRPPSKAVVEEEGEYTGPIEAFGVKGMQSKQWRKIFKNFKQLEKWVEKHDAEIHGTRKPDGIDEDSTIPGLPGSTQSSSTVAAVQGKPAAGKIGKVVIKTPDGKESAYGDMVVKEEDREKQGSDDMSEVLDRVHKDLDGDYNPDAVKAALHSVSDDTSMSYIQLLKAWVESPDGMSKALDAIKSSSEDDKETDDLANLPDPSKASAAPQAPVAPQAPMPVAEGKFGVFSSGGSIGSKNDEPVKTFDTKEEADAKAKSLNKSLTPGEKSYYKMKYKVKQITEGHSMHFEINDHHEVSMVQAELYKIVKNATELHELLENQPHIEGWIQAKIAIAAENVASVRDHMEYEHTQQKQGANVQPIEAPIEPHHAEVVDEEEQYCPGCSGSGMNLDEDDPMQHCTECGGSGMNPVFGE